LPAAATISPALRVRIAQHASEEASAAPGAASAVAGAEMSQGVRAAAGR